MRVSLCDHYDFHESLNKVPCKLKHGEVFYNREHYRNSQYIVNFFGLIITCEITNIRKHANTSRCKLSYGLTT